MPYLRCPSCGLLAHMVADDSAPIECPRCRALQQRVQLLPVEESLRQVGGSMAGLRPDPPSQ